MEKKRRILLRLPSTIHDAVKARAESTRTSINSLLEHYIERGLQAATNPNADAEIVNLAKREFGTKFLRITPVRISSTRRRARYLRHRYSDDR
jgi:hypothetical protein